MEKSYVTNNHFRRVLNEVSEYLKKDQNPPEELIIEFIAELRVSNFLIPGFIKDNKIFHENIVSDDDKSVSIQLYTDDEEFIKDKGLNSQYNPMPFDIRYFIEMINEEDYKGAVLNFSSECFFLSKEMLNELPLNQNFKIPDDFTGYGPEQLKNIAENTRNDSMINFIRNPSNQADFEKLMYELSKATFLNVIINNTDFKEFEHDGYISLDGVEGWEVCSSGIDDDNFGILFTSIDAISDTLDPVSGYYYAYQVTVLSQFIDHVLRSDSEGIIINPGLDDFFIPRSFLLLYSDSQDNPSFKNAVHYAFLLYPEF